MTWVVVRKVFISSSIDRPLANNFLAIRQISEKSGYLSLMMKICWWANFLTRRQSFRQIILCPPHCGIRGNSRLLHGVAVTWRPMIFQIFGKALLPDRKCKCHCGWKTDGFPQPPGLCMSVSPPYHWRTGRIWEACMNGWLSICRNWHTGYTSQSVP